MLKLREMPGVLRIDARANCVSRNKAKQQTTRPPEEHPTMTTTLRKLCAAMTATLLHVPLAHAAMSDNVIRIGVLNDRSGAYADLGGEGSVIAAKMAAEEFGSAIGGVPVEIVSADHQNKPDIGLGIVRRWFDTEKSMPLPTFPIRAWVSR
jgi:ABC-type branched-subunit amino acid transport system substrate-binding protein